MTPEQARKQLWLEGNLSWKLHPGQELVYEKLRALPKETREAIVLIARRWGKSFLAVVMALEDCLLKPYCQSFIVGPNLKQTRKIVTPLINLITADAPRGLIKQTKSELLWNVGNSQLMIGAFDTAIESFRGMEGESIYLEESGLANPEEYDYTLMSVLFPILMHTKGRITHFTTPAKELNHPLHTKSIPKAALNNALYRYTIMDNPLLTPEEKEQEIENLGGLESDHCKRELFCQIVKDEKSTVIPEFDDALYVREMEIPSHAYWLSSLDFGGVLDKHGLILCFYDFERAKLCVWDERFLEKNSPTKLIIEAGLDMEKSARWLTEDPYRVSDCPGQIIVDLRNEGYRVITPDKEKGSWEAGINAIRLGFTRNQIEIHPRCKFLIASLTYGQYTKNRKDFARTEEFGHLDLLSALIYADRHKITNNPFPPHMGKSRVTHFISRKEQENQEALEDALRFI